MSVTRSVVWAMIVGFALFVGAYAQQSAVVAKAEPQPVGKGSSKKVKADVDVTSKAAAGTAVVEDPLIYHIGVEDELGISVWHEPDLSTSAVVRPDGMITLPLLNDLKVTGMTTKQLQDMLTERLKDFLKEPQVTVIARQIHSRKVYLMGEVVRPGTYPLNTPKTVLQLLAEAGGPGAYAKVGSIYVIRQQNGARVTLPFHYKKAMSGKSIGDDISLQPGDMVIVP